MNDYQRYEPTNMQMASGKADEVCLTPRLELTTNGKRFSNIYDAGARMEYIHFSDSVEVIVHGRLRDREGNPLPGESSPFTIRYSFGPQRFRMAVHVIAPGTKLLFPMVSTASERVAQRVNGEMVFEKALARMTIKSTDSLATRTANTERVFNFVPGFEAVVVETGLDEKGEGSVSIQLERQVHAGSNRAPLLHEQRPKNKNR